MRRLKRFKTRLIRRLKKLKPDFTPLIRKWTLRWKTFKRKVSAFKARVKARIEAIKRFFLNKWEKYVLKPWRIIKRYWERYVWRYVLKSCRFIARKLSYFFWKTFVFTASDTERERYHIFMDSLGGWKNITSFACRSKSWHFKVIHSFLIDWEQLNAFRIKILFWSWPDLELSVGSYSRWIYKRLKRFTYMPRKVRRKRFRKFKKIGKYKYTK